MRTRRQRIFMGLTEIAGYYTNLREGLRSLGYEADFISFFHHPFAYSIGDTKGPCLGSIRKLRLLISQRSAVRMPLLLILAPIYGLLVTLYFLWAACRYDVFIYGARSHMLPWMLDFPVLRLFGRKVICIFHGSDSRPPYLNGVSTNKPLHTVYKETRRAKYEISIINKYAHHIVDHPPTSQFHTRAVIQWLAVGIPFAAPKQVSADTHEGRSQVTRILHAPSRPEEKGSPLIEAAVSQLREAGLALELVTIVNRPNREVLDALAGCDFIIDELYSDTTMAGLATEAAWFGKPSLVGGYELAELASLTPAGLLPPAHVVHPDHLLEGIRKLAQDHDYRKELGRRAQAFVHERWAAREVARRLVRIIDTGPAEDWLWQPQDTMFVCGWGMPEQKRKVLMDAFVSKYGRDALHVSDKPALENKLVAEAGRV